MSIKILLVDDHKLMREGLRSLIEREPGLAVAGEAKDGWTALSLIQETVPDIVIMDVTMPELNGIETTLKILEQMPCTRVIALSMHSDRRVVLEMLKAGASGYILKDGDFKELIGAIHAVYLGKIYLSPQVADIVVKDYIQVFPKNGHSVFSVLTSREREVLQLIAKGWSTKEIASKLDVSVKTIETFRSHIMEKLNIHNVAELTKYAIREGLTTL